MARLTIRRTTYAAGRDWHTTQERCDRCWRRPGIENPRPNLVALLFVYTGPDTQYYATLCPDCLRRYLAGWHCSKGPGDLVSLCESRTVMGS